MSVVYIELARKKEESDEEFVRRRKTETITQTLREAQNRLQKARDGGIVHERRLGNLMDAVEMLASTVELIA